jgi:hypothetical protein
MEPAMAIPVCDRFPWDEAVEAELARLVAQRLSGMLIARRLSLDHGRRCTKGMVVARVKRLGLRLQGEVPRNRFKPNGFKPNGFKPNGFAGALAPANRKPGKLTSGGFHAASRQPGIASRPATTLAPRQNPTDALPTALAGLFSPRPSRAERQAELFAAAPSTAVALTDLGPRQCRWPYGEGPFLFCGCPTAPRAAYCEAHRRIASAPAPRPIEEELKGVRF